MSVNINDIMTNQEAADYLGVDRNNFRRMVENGKITPYKVGYVTVYTRKDLDALKNQYFAEGLTHTDIGKMYGVGRTNVMYHFRRLGVKPIGQNNHRRAGAIYDLETVRKFAKILGWVEVPQNQTDEASDPAPEAVTVD